MFRPILVSAFGLIVAIAANAGSIEIGGASGLTNSYLTSAGGGSACAAGAGNCITGSTGGYAEQNYDNVLFAGATGGTAPAPFTGYTTSGSIPVGKTATSAAGTTFAMIAGDSNAGATSNFWGSTGNETITVPIGVFGATDAALMLQNVWGSVGGNDTSVTFNFGSTANATSGLTSVVVNLTDVNNVSGSGATGQIRAGTLCNTTTSASCNTTTNPQNSPVAVSTNVGGSGVTVDASQVYGAPESTTYVYTSVNPNVGFYANTAGHLRLDDQDFIFGSAFLNKWLVSVQVTENDGDTSFQSETALSAVTVGTAPEPTTILLALFGLGGIGLAKRFRRA